MAKAYLIQVILASLGVINGWLVTIVAQMAGRDKAVAPCQSVSTQILPLKYPNKKPTDHCCQGQRRRGSGALC